MSTMEVSPELLFDSFPEPVLLLENGAVSYCNPSARQLFPGLAAGAAVPEELSPLSEAAASSVIAGGARILGTEYLVSVQPVGEKMLAILRPGISAPVAPSPERLAVSLRRETAGLAAMLQRMDPREMPGEEKIKKYLSFANQGVYRLLRLADHLEFLDTEDEVLYRPSPLDLAGFCGGLARQLESLCAEAGYRFAYETECTCLLTVGDEALLQRLILELVSNAMKAVGSQGGLGLRLSLSGERAVLTVWDSGAGVPEGELYRLFGTRMGQSPGTNPADGLGVGLDAVRRIARLHGGTVMVEDRPGECFKAVVALPVKSSREMPLHAPETAYSKSFSSVMVELSDVLPARLYAPEELE